VCRARRGCCQLSPVVGFVVIVTIAAIDASIAIYAIIAIDAPIAIYAIIATTDAVDAVSATYMSHSTLLKPQNRSTTLPAQHKRSIPH
jgi:hypothetical protein